MATAPTPDAFIVEFPEFAKAPVATINACIARAVARTQDTSNADLWNALVSLKAAQYLALKPQGRSMKLSQKDGTTVYDAQIKTLRRAVNIGFRTY